MIRVSGVGDLVDGEVRAITVRGRKLVLIRHGDDRYATPNRCSHLGVRLSDGHLCGSVVECRWHHWRFDLADGSVDGEDPIIASFETYIVHNDGDDLLIDPRPRRRANTID